MSTNHRRDNEARRSDKAFRKMQEGLAQAIFYIDQYREEVQEERATLTSFIVKCDYDDEAGVLLVIKGYEGSTWRVSFHRGTTVTEALTGLGNRLRNGSLKWRDDDYANSK